MAKETPDWIMLAAAISKARKDEAFRERLLKALNRDRRVLELLSTLEPENKTTTNRDQT